MENLIVKVKIFAKFILKALLIIIACALLGIALLTLVYCIPTEKVNANVEVSSKTFEIEAIYHPVFTWCHSQLDNFTDALMLLETVYESDKSKVYQAMAVPGIGYNSPTVDIVRYYNGEKDDVIGLNPNRHYARYWHGYLVFLRPLLVFMSYVGIRSLNTMLQTVLTVLLIGALVKKNMKRYIIPVVIALLFFNPIVIGMSMQFSSCYYIMLIASILIVYFKEKLKDKIVYLFLGIGIATAFFDFLTYPLATFGIPALLYFGTLDLKEKKFKELVLIFVKIGFSWCLGYGGMWFSKWAFSSIIMQENIIKSGSKSVLIRTGTEGYPLVTTVRLNIDWCFNTPVKLIFIAYVIYMLVRILINWKKLINNKKLIFFNFILPFAVIATLPILWYIILRNHSYVHIFMTCKAFIVSIFAVAMCLENIYKFVKE